MKLILGWLAALVALVMGIGVLPALATQAKELPVPTLSLPTAGATIDQPIFEWTVDAKPEANAPVAHYEIEVALDDQFVTMVDPPKGATPGVPQPLAAYGTTYIPTRSYQAKTMFWHVRAVGTDGDKGEWSSTSDFVRRWTNDDEKAGEEFSGVPASRVENVELVGGGSSPPINDLAITWDPVPGAAGYEVQFSLSARFPNNDEATASCFTPHAVLTPHISGGYLTRPENDSCDINSPLQPWIASTWSESQPGVNTIAGTGVEAGDAVVVRYPPARTGVTLSVLTAGENGFTVSDDSSPAGEMSGTVEWYKKTLKIEPNDEYYVRVRAIDLTTGPDYPSQFKQVLGLWSDQRREPDESSPDALRFIPAGPTGTGSLTTPAEPLRSRVTSTDVPLLKWQPAPDADLYRVVVALDRDFTDVVARYETRSAQFVPANTFDDNGSSTSYFWYALPCVLDIHQLSYCPPDRDAINNPTYVASFAKRSAPLTALSATPADASRHAILRWEDALTASEVKGHELPEPATPGGVSHYQLQISTSRNWAVTPIVTTDNLAYATTVEPAAPAGIYYWRVRPLDGDGARLAWSAVNTFKIAEPPAPPTPTPSVSPSESPSVPPSTSPPVSPSTSPPVPPSTSPPQTPTQPTATPSANYDINPGAGGGTGNVAPTRPGKPAVSKVAKRTLRVRWNASTAFSDPVTGYLLFRSINGSDFALAAQTSARKVRLRAKPGATYRFYVVANSAAGKSSASATRTFTMR